MTLCVLLISCCAVHGYEKDYQIFEHAGKLNSYVYIKIKNSIAANKNNWWQLAVVASDVIAIKITLMTIILHNIWTN